MAIVNAGTLAFLLKKEMAIATVATTAFWAKVMAITTVATTAICQNLNGYCYCGQQYLWLTSIYPPVEKAI